ncbi:carotenoid oxygenase family protein [Natronomonas sp.]|uniref:carotenoid oxygenase family protein n=1 Tax=Natronomonas sp. TaxID=2184060 RepID=UPI0039749362
MNASTDYRAGLRTQREEIENERLSVDGSFPDWLTGDLVGNGPGQFEAGDTRLRHWFDPLAMLRRFRIDDGEVTYANRFVGSRDYEFAERNGGVRTPFPGTPPDRPLWTRIRQVLDGTFPDNPVIGVQRFGDEFAAITESPTALTFDPDTLETTGRKDLTAGLDSDLTLAHVHYDRDEGVFYNLGVSYGRETVYTLFRRPADGGTPTPLDDHSAGPLAVGHQVASGLGVVRCLHMQVLRLRQDVQHRSGHLAPVVVHHRQVHHPNRWVVRAI